MNILNKNAEKISALADGELSHAQDEELVTVLGRSENRQIWQNCYCIGDMVRASDTKLSLSDGFSERMFKRLSSEPVYMPRDAASSVPEKKVVRDFFSDRPSAGGVWVRRFLFPGMAVLTAAVMTIFAMPKFGGTSFPHGLIVKSSSKLESTLSSATTNNAPALSYAMSDEYFREHQRYSPSVYSIPQYARFASSVDESDK